MIQKYSFVINVEKSSLISTQKIQWLGLIWDTRSQSMSLPKSFQLKVQTSLLCKSITRRQLKRIIGLLNFACVTNPLLRTYLKRISHSLRHMMGVKKRDISTPLSLVFKQRLFYWLKPEVLKSQVLWCSPPPTVELFTDPSNHGWGFHTSDLLMG